MANVEKLVEIGAVVLQVIQTGQELFQKNSSNDILEIGDSLMFLTTRSLGFSQNGGLVGNFEKVGQTLLQLSEIFLIGIVLLFAFRCLFSYLLYKKQEIPWRFFLRIILVGILACGAYYVCFTAVFFTENMTEYIRETLGKEDTSFEVLEKQVDKLEFKMSGEEDAINLFDAENIVNILAHFSSVAVGISIGIRYFLLELFILFSPIFFLFLGSEETKDVFIWWLKMFVGLLACQLFVAILLGVFSFQSYGNGTEKSILLVACLILIVKVCQSCIRKNL